MTFEQIAPLLLGLGLMASCAPEPPPDLSEDGISRALATHREATLTDVRYQIELRVPERRSEALTGRVVVRFHWDDSRGLPVVLDLQEPEERVRALRVNGVEAEWSAENNHIVLTPDQLQADEENEVEIEVLAGDGSLNRQEEFLYTLFVPDRAHHALPLFDQPGLKARFSLMLEVPTEWAAVANGPLREEYASEGGGRILRFEETEPISTYLFAFAAGHFELVTREVGGRTMTLYHRETDSDRVKRNLDAIFELHQTAVDWMEEYTGASYPFAKLDFVAVPDFQYGGMEHPGKILYRAANLFLEESATHVQELGRASLIAHETAHMWFGNLVTHPWFDDVWMKEVFANFMAARIVHPSFPDVDHDLRFVLSHHPRAYAVDRSLGAHPIRQELGNLIEAGTLYGPIVYQKAPVVMRQLEALVGEEAFREGLRLYLDRYAYGNASWTDLVEIFDPLHPVDLEEWSRVWVLEGGRPDVSVAWEETAVGEEGDARIRALRLRQTDPANRGRAWPQRLEPVVGAAGGLVHLEVDVLQEEAVVSAAEGLPVPDFVLPDASGIGYAGFRLDRRSREYLLEHLPGVPEARIRAAGHLALWDEFLEGRVAAEELLFLLIASLEDEEDLIVDEVLSHLRTLWWLFLDEGEREARADDLERRLWDLVEEADETARKAQYFRALRSVFVTEETGARFAGLLAGEGRIRGFPLTESERTDLAFALAIREVDGWEAILDEEEGRIQNPDRVERFRYLRPSVSDDPAVREAFFELLRERESRSREGWVSTGLAHLNHPLRREHAQRFVRPALEMMEEIQRTGDIFFPQQWIGAVLSGHASPEVAEEVLAFLAEEPRLPERLEQKVLQASDLLFRASGAEPSTTGSGEGAGR